MMRQRTRAPLWIYVTVVSIVGLAVMLAVLIVRGPAEFAAETPSLAILIVLVIIGELYPIRVPVRDESEDVTISTAFMFAVLLLSGPAAAITAQALASLLSDLRGHKPWWKTTFNIAQYSLAIAGSALAFALVSNGHYFSTAGQGLSGRNLFGVAAAGTAFFLLNNLFVVGAMATAQGLSVLRRLRSDLTFQAATTAVLLSQGPLVALAATRSLVWVLLFLPGTYAIYRSAQISVEKEYLSEHDLLTGLPNRLLFCEHLGRHLDDDTINELVVMLIDLDGFKDVNDTLGHHVGDALLQQVGRRLASDLPEISTVARLGGDEFALIALVAGTAARELGGQVLQALQAPFELQGLPFHIEASVGGAIYPDHGTDIDTLIQHSDVAMYLAKEQRSGYETYHASHDRYSPRRLALLGELRRAIDQRELVLHYQPKAELASGRIVGVEALVRWDHPEHGLLGPDEFIPLAEPTGIIGPLTQHVLELALAQCRTWRDDGIELTVAVNISARNLYDTTIVDDIEALLTEHHLPADALRLELTESFLMADPRRAEAVLAHLHHLGIRIALDDFGTGYSSLAYLKRLPVDELKIDKSFVMNMATDANDATIVASTIHLGHSLGLTVVAEGVESEHAWQQLLDLGCDLAQGYYLSRPVTADRLTRWLANQPTARSSPPEHATPAPLRVVETSSSSSHQPLAAHAR